MRGSRVISPAHVAEHEPWSHVTSTRTEDAFNVTKNSNALILFSFPFLKGREGVDSVSVLSC